MRTGTPFTLCLALLALGAAGASEWRAREHRLQAEWQLTRATAYADGYVQTFDGTHVESQLTAFAHRRAALAQAERWEQGRSLAVLLAALMLIVAYAQWFHGQVEACRLDRLGAGPATPEPSPSAALAGAQS